MGRPGTFMRSISPHNLNAYLQNFNNTYGNGSTLTPAGQALVTAGLFTESELVQLGAVIPAVPLAPANNAGNGSYRDVDTVLSWPIKLRERITILPSISFFNVFNFSNFGPLGGASFASSNSTGLAPGPGSINGTVAGVNAGSNTVRIGRGSGVFAVGAPRESEFGLRIDF